jgi:hypothetical protein
MKPQPVTMQQLQQLGLPLLGKIVFYSLAGVRIPHADLQTALAAAGFGAFLPDPPTARKAMTRAIGAWVEARAVQGQGPALTSDRTAASGPDDEAERAIVRIVNRKADAQMAFVLVEERVSFKRLGLRHGTALRVILAKDPRQKQFYCTTTAAGLAAQQEANQVTQELGPYFTQYTGLLLPEDLSKMMRAILARLDAVSLRRGGGIYLIPQAHEAALGRLETLIRALPHQAGTHPYCTLLPVVDEVAARQGLSAAVFDGLLAEIAAARVELQRSMDAAPGTVKPETVAKRQAEITLLQTKIGIFATLVSGQQARLVQECQELQHAALQVLVSDRMARPKTTSPAAPVGREDEIADPPPDPPAAVAPARAGAAA